MFERPVYDLMNDFLASQRLGIAACLVVSPAAIPRLLPLETLMKASFQDQSIAWAMRSMPGFRHTGNEVVSSTWRQRQFTHRTRETRTL